MKWLVTTLIILLGILQYQLWFQPGSIFQAWHLNQQLTQLNTENQKLKTQNKNFIAEVHALKKGQQAIEQYARHDLGLIKKGETFYQIVK